MSRLWPVAAVLVLLGVLLLLAGCAIPPAYGPVAYGPAADVTVVPPASGPQAPDLTAPVRPVRHLEQARPVGLTAPAIDLATSALTDLQADEGGVLEQPTNASTVGWSTLGPTPGARGPAVIAGHRRLDGAPGVFARLAELAPGDRVGVHRDDGTEAVFTVYRTARFATAAFPGEDVHGDTAGPELRLITAGGVFDRGDGEFGDNVVVFARLDGAR